MFLHLPSFSLGLTIGKLPRTDGQARDSRQKGQGAARYVLPRIRECAGVEADRDAAPSHSEDQKRPRCCCNRIPFSSAQLCKLTRLSGEPAILILPPFHCASSFFRGTQVCWVLELPLVASLATTIFTRFKFDLLRHARFSPFSILSTSPYYHSRGPVPRRARP